ncbi:MAG: hypothetical protein LBE22_00620 [Azoarcus sp.]|jgi:hypothetical protein|nr:hypothetical protein [Azoarcus sp.]
MNTEIFRMIERRNAEKRANNTRRALVVAVIGVTLGTILSVQFLGTTIAALSGAILISILFGSWFILYLTGAVFIGNAAIPDDLLLNIASSRDIDTEIKVELGRHLETEGVITFSELTRIVNDFYRSQDNKPHPASGVAALIRFYKGETP